MKRFSSYLSAAVAIVVMSLGSLPASAATSPGSSGLSITPRKDYTIQAGKSESDKLTIGNLSSTQDLNVSLKLIDFTFTDQSGTPKLLLATNAPQTSWSLKPFVTLPKTVLIPAGQTKTVNYTIKVPANQGAGSYYSAFEYAATGANGGNVSLNASGVTLAFLSIPGTVREGLMLQKFGAYQSDPGNLTGHYLYIATNKAPQQLAYALKNSGNVAESPAGSIVLKDMFGHLVKTVGNVNVNSNLALLGQTRLFTACIESQQTKVNFDSTSTPTTSCVNPHLKPGRYTASLDVFYGQNGNRTNEITATAHFWYLPWWFLIAVVVIIVLIAGGIWWLQRKIKAAIKGTAYHANGKRSR
jgi:hypothetical protein